MFKRPVFLVVISLLSVAALLAGGIILGHRPSESASVEAKPVYADSEDVSEMLNGLKVEPENKSKYSKVMDADSWKVEHYCTTRVRVLKEESIVQLKYRSGERCKPESGEWISPYDGLVYTRPQSLQIDHMIPKDEAWESGAWLWTDSRIGAFKNDLGYGPSLIAVTSKVNRTLKNNREPGRNSKDSKDYYLPSRTEYVCTYVAEWVAVKYRWSLSVDSTEKSNLQELLDSCRGDVKIPFPAKATLPSED